MHASCLSVHLSTFFIHFSILSTNSFTSVLQSSTLFLHAFTFSVHFANWSAHCLKMWGGGHYRLTEAEVQQFFSGCDRKRFTDTHLHILLFWKRQCYRPTKANVDSLTWWRRVEHVDQVSHWQIQGRELQCPQFDWLLHLFLVRASWQLSLWETKPIFSHVQNRQVQYKSQHFKF